MVKYIILLFIILSSCTQYTAITPEIPKHDLILDNNIINLDLYENNRQVFVQNIGSQLIIKLDYNINDKNIIIYDTLVPNEELFLYSWAERLTYDVIVKINNVEFY